MRYTILQLYSEYATIIWVIVESPYMLLMESEAVVLLDKDRMSNFQLPSLSQTKTYLKDPMSLKRSYGSYTRVG